MITPRAPGAPACSSTSRWYISKFGSNKLPQIYAATKDGAGQYLELTLEIQSGPSQGRRLWDRLNLQNRNPKAVEIAQKQLAQLCHATGILQLPNDATPLHKRPVVMKVAVKNDPERGPINEIKGYKAKAATNAPAFQAPRVTAAAATAAPAMPWAKVA